MKIFINHSPPEELKKHKGVGPVLAARIIQYREAGPFKDLEDLQDRVPGISAQTIRSWVNQQDVIVTFADRNNRDQEPCDGVYLVPISKSVCIALSFCAVLLMLALLTVGMVMGEMWNSIEIPVKPIHPNKWRNSGYPHEPLNLNSSMNNTIYFHCMDDEDCPSGYRCFTGKLHPEERPFNLSDADFVATDFQVKSKFGTEPLSSMLRTLMKWTQQESGRKCWYVATEEGEDCGGILDTVCDAEANLTCVYGKCAKSDDEWLLRGIRGKGFVPDQSRNKRDVDNPWNGPCTSLADCLGAPRRISSTNEGRK